MLFYNKLIYYFYIFLAILAILAPENYSLFTISLAVFLFLFSFFLFKKGSSVFKYKIEINDSNIIYTQTNSSDIYSSKILLFSTIYAVIFIPMYVQFYTGLSVIDTLTLYFSSNSMDSTYYLYQQYFNESNIGAFTFNKLPLILGFGLFKILFILSLIRNLAYKKNPSLKDIILIVIITAMFYIVGISRGTSFEMFEIVLSVIFVLLMRMDLHFNRNWFRGKLAIFIYSLLGLAMFSFLLTKSLRYADASVINTHITNTLYLDQNSFMFKHFPPIALFFHELVGYFVFGTYFIASIFDHIWLDSFKGLLTMITPFGPDVFDYGINYKDALCGKYIDCGVAWVPDSAKLYSSLGLILSFFLMWLIGVISKKMYINYKSNDIVSAIILYLITLQMISFPIGNFLFVSSANVLVLITMSILTIFKIKFKIFKI